MHYKKDGSLDMRFSSSKAAVASGSYSACTGSGSRASGGPSSSSTGGFFGAGSSSHGSSVPSPSSNQHQYKKDGSLDMRYASSKQAVAASGGNTGAASASRSGASGGSGTQTGESGLQYKKDGSLDMRYASSKQAVASSEGLMETESGLHYKKDGSLDMRYASSKKATALEASGGRSSDRSGRAPGSASEVATKMAAMRVGSSGNYGIPASVPTKKDGTPDMRTSAAKSWVADQARIHGNKAPDWVPRLKDGTINVFNPLGRAYKDAAPHQAAQDAEFDDIDDQQRRADYWQRRWEESKQFQQQFETQMEVDVPEPVPHQQQDRPSSAESSQDVGLEEIDVQQLTTIEEIGRGGFGVVEEAEWRGRRVAVKRLHLGRLTRSAKETFRKELDVARRLHLFQHPNLVATLAYCIEPPIIVMELLPLGSLAFVLHYCEEPDVEAKICDGRIKRQLAFGIADGVRQLHAALVCHRDLKPHNVLVAANWTAKVGDFGLAELRGLTSCTVASEQLQQDDAPGHRQCNPAGTAAYMAPELLNSDKPSDFSCDVYSFGVLLNELCSEEQPYSGRVHCFDGRGPFGAANYARLGNRPTLARGIPEHVIGLIKRCWDAEPKCRPTFEEIVRAIEDRRFVLPNGGGLRGC